MTATDISRGQDATTPLEVPLLGWRDVILRTYRSVIDHRISVVAAGVGFFALLAVFPAIGAFISLSGYILDPLAMQEQVAGIARILPGDAASILTDQAHQVATDDQRAGIGAIFGLLLAIYSSSLGIKTLMQGLNIAYREREKRNFIVFNMVGLGLTFLGILGLLVALSSTIVAPLVVEYLGLPHWIDSLITWARWPILLCLTVLGLSVLYYFGPSRRSARWQWLSPGAIAATVLWLIASYGFSLYVQNFASYNETYGTLGGVIILLTWMWLSSFVVLLGAELNAALEHQTNADSTIGPDRPPGERGAVVADTVAEIP